MLFFVAAAAVGHETPNERIVLDLLLLPGRSIGQSSHLSTGELVRLTYLLPNGVLSILNHDGFRLYLGFSDSPSDPLQWFEPPPGASGFYCFGGSREAVVEIVALNDIDIIFSCCYIDDCVRVSSPPVGAVWQSPRTCFLSTDVSAEVHVSGNATGASIGLLTPSIATVFNDSNAISEDGIRAHPFNIVSIQSEPAARQGYTIEFIGGRRSFAFKTIEAGAGRGIVGAENRSQFRPVIGEFDYPQLAGTDPVVVTVFLVFIVILTFMMCVCTIVCCISLMCTKQTEEFAPTPPLYDERPDVSDSKSDTDTEHTRKDSDSDSARPEPSSPYETL
jgi:hypothetical protein